MRAQCLGMMTFPALPSVPSGHLVPFTDQLRLAVAAYLARLKGASRYHTESDLRCYLAWCTEHALDPLAARRPHLDAFPGNALADAKRWAAAIGVPAYAIDEQTAIKVEDGSVEVVSEGRWTKFG